MVTEPEFEVKRIPVAERYGEYAVGGHTGEEIARELGSRMLLLVDFEEVICPDGYMLLRLLQELQVTRKKKLHSDSLWAFTNTNPDTFFSVDKYVAPHLRTGVVCTANDEPILAGATAVHRKNYELAKNLSIAGSFTAADFADYEGIDSTTANMRLKKLLPTGAVCLLPPNTREHDRPPVRYRAVISNNVKSL
jgi:hypothetical protein